MVSEGAEPKRKRKAIDCHKPQLVIFKIPPSTKETQITINTEPKKRRAYAEVPEGTSAEFTDKE